MEIDGIDGLNSVVGNAKPTTRIQQISQRMHWHFRLSNYDNDDIDGLDTLFREICTDYIFQEEIGEKTNTPHLQGAICLKKPMRYTEFSPDRRIHWEPQGSLKNKGYCSKTNTRKPGGRICYGGSYKPPTIIKLINPSMFYPWQKRFYDIIVNDEPDDRTVHWIWSAKGNNGKSAFTKFCVMKLNTVPAISGKYGDIINLVFKQDMDKCRSIIFDIPRNNGNNVSYTSIESIKNGLIVNTKYETGYKIFNPPHIIVFANKAPDLERLSEDKWTVMCLDE